MNTEEKLKLMAAVKSPIIKYLEDQLQINMNALQAYDNISGPMAESDEKIRIMREQEAIKLRDRAYELNRHIAVIKLM